MRSVRTAAVLALSLALSVGAFAATPVILSISPSTVVAGGPSFTLTVNGANFVSGAIVHANGVNLGTNFVSSTQLTATINSAQIVNAGTLSITVTNPSTVASGAVTLTIAPNQPQITTLDPASVPTGNQNVTVTANGSNFAQSAIVRVNGTARSDLITARLWRPRWTTKPSAKTQAQQ